MYIIPKKYQYRITSAINTGRNDHWMSIESDTMNVEDERALEDCFKDFARWIYKFIDAEYDNRMSDEVVDDSILANEYTFTESGKFEGA